MEDHRKEVNQLRDKLKQAEATQSKQLQTKKFLIDKLKEERGRLQRLLIFN